MRGKAQPDGRPAVYLSKRWSYFLPVVHVQRHFSINILLQ